MSARRRRGSFIHLEIQRVLVFAGYCLCDLQPCVGTMRMNLSRAIVYVLKTDRIPKILISTLPVYLWCMLVFWVLFFLSGWLISCGSYLLGILIVRREALPSSLGSYYR